MYSPNSQHSQSPFISLRNSQAQTSKHTHSRNTSTTKSISSTQTAEPIRIPSQRKLTLTHQQAQIHSQAQTTNQDYKLKMRVLAEEESNGKFGPLRGAAKGEQRAILTQESLMISFQQGIENLKREYLQSLREYEAKIDELQQQLHRNNKELSFKNSQICRLEATIRQIKQRERQKEEDLESQLHLRIQDLEKRLSIISTFIESSTLQTQQSMDKLTHRIMRNLGGRLQNLREQQFQFAKIALSKLVTLEHRLESKQKQEQSVGTRGSMDSTEEPAATLQDQGVSFWDDCFFYPGEHSENCNLIAEMSSRRSQPLKCWVDPEGFLRYCDSGSFLFNRRGERVVVGWSELEWLREQGMIRIY